MRQDLTGDELKPVHYVVCTVDAIRACPSRRHASHHVSHATSTVCTCVEKRSGAKSGTC